MARIIKAEERKRGKEAKMGKRQIGRHLLSICSNELAEAKAALLPT